jgi:hypothetical protein
VRLDYMDELYGPTCGDDLHRELRGRRARLAEISSDDHAEHRTGSVSGNSQDGNVAKTRELQRRLATAYSVDDLVSPQPDHDKLCSAFVGDAGCDVRWVALSGLQMRELCGSEFPHLRTNARLCPRSPRAFDCGIDELPRLRREADERWMHREHPELGVQPASEYSGGGERAVGLRQSVRGDQDRSRGT